MPKNDLDFLITDKQPFTYLERARVSVSKGCLVSKKDDIVTTIPSCQIALLLLGGGTSVTHEAACVAAQDNMMIAFAKGGISIHSIWHSARYGEPKGLVRQVLIQSDENSRLMAAKWLLERRMKNEGATLAELADIDAHANIDNLMLHEARWAKRIYAELARVQQTKFRRDHGGSDKINSTISILNNALYGFVTAVLFSLGLNPSIGFMHGLSRRGGLTFDIADIYKYQLCLVPAFRAKNDSSVRELLLDMNRALTKDRKALVKDIIATTKGVLACK